MTIELSSLFWVTLAAYTAFVTRKYMFSALLIFNLIMIEAFLLPTIFTVPPTALSQLFYGWYPTIMSQLTILILAVYDQMLNKGESQEHTGKN